MSTLVNRRFSEAAQRAAERRKREDEAPRLREKVPFLESLNLDVEERSAGASVPEASHVRRIVVEHAPALFAIPCTDHACRDGGHDLTHQILHSLSNRETEFEGEDACNGQIGSSACRRVLRYVAHAKYRS